MFGWFQRVFFSSSQYRLKQALDAEPHWVFVAVVFFVGGLLQLILQLVFHGLLFSLAAALAVAAAGAYLFAASAGGRWEWLTGSWPVRICLDLWNHDEE